jgi:hypothetical protein
MSAVLATINAVTITAKVKNRQPDRSSVGL